MCVCVCVCVYVCVYTKLCVQAWNKKATHFRLMFSFHVASMLALQPYIDANKEQQRPWLGCGLMSSAPRVSMCP